MTDAQGRKGNSAEITLERLAAIDRLLLEGIKVGPASKRRAINKVVREVPEFTRGDCWQRIRHLRKTPQLANLQARQRRDGRSRSSKPCPEGRTAPRRWTAADDDKLLNWAGYEPVNKIAHRLSRSVRAIRFRLSALGMSAKVTDGWSLRALRKLLRVSPDRLRQFIGSGMLRVRDPRIKASSLAEFCHKNATSITPAVRERVELASAKKREGYPWERTADLLGAELSQLQRWISTGQLRVMDAFVTDRSFEEFCKTHGSEINLALIDPATAKWLIEEYGVPPPASGAQVASRAQKHALKLRTCRCGRTIAGNVYFRHAKTCKVVAESSDAAGRLGIERTRLNI